MAKSPDDSSRATVNTRIVRVRDLPIYYDPKSEDIQRYLPRADVNSTKDETNSKGWLYTSISQTRQSIQQIWNDNKELRDRIVRGVETGEAHTKATIDYIRDDETLLPKVGVVTVAGLGGLLLGHRGGALRKSFYSSVSAFVALSACYPKRTSAAMDYVYIQIQKQTEQIFDKTGQQSSSSTTINEHKDRIIHTKTNENQPVTNVKGDFGQGTPADQHLYTTRGSSNEN